MSRKAGQRNYATAPYIASFSSLATYRLPVLKLVSDHFGESLQIFAGDRAYDTAIRLIEQDSLPHTRLHNIVLIRQLLIQRINLAAYLRCEVLLLDLNPRLLHIWPILLLRRLLQRRTVLWGHAWPRAGRNSPSEPIRHAMRGLASALIAYTESQAAELRDVHAGKEVYAAPNALFYQRDCTFDDMSDRDALVYVGRLTAAKKPLLLIKAFNSLAREDLNVRLIIVGDGLQFDRVLKAVNESPHASRITVMGHIADSDRLRRIYASAIVSVSPGYVGLAATQSFAFGVPMVISRTEPHAPELEAAEEGTNSVFFNTDDVGHLKRTLESAIANKDIWHSRGASISERCGNLYSIERMAEGIIESFGAGP